MKQKEISKVINSLGLKGRIFVSASFPGVIEFSSPGPKPLVPKTPRPNPTKSQLVPKGAWD